MLVCKYLLGSLDCAHII
jgi:TatD DNase family protein